ncbi:MAG: hypothetical protein OHM77_09450 [Candidatus Nitricoxidivorans perseverans]|uniref:Uncharacterized protein n=1 Tax=Candidatus Nitricoxidivorans perseverans TaxID=2975601 RepID=A0AA49FK00_9PROT|nr:MAG: hypothetical protein OHM77_09450 [Candidatus Nitricoxidivorans perseverans]
MSPRAPLRSGWLQTLMAGAVLSVAAPAGAEILFLEGGRVASAEPDNAYRHPSLRSVVFVSPEARQMAILPPAPVFVPPPPLLWRVPTPFIVPPPGSAAIGINASTRPSNRDVASYNLQRAHNFSRNLYDKDTYLNYFGASSPLSPYWYSYYGAFGPAYPPAAGNGGFNQPARPSNRDITTYHLDRAHRFGMDAYKKP